MKLAMQCPGCFSVNMIERPDDDHVLECDSCAEKLAIIDLRDGGAAPLNVDRSSLILASPALDEAASEGSGAASEASPDEFQFPPSLTRFIPVWMSTDEAEGFLLFIHAASEGKVEDWPEREWGHIADAWEQEKPRTLEEMQAIQAFAIDRFGDRSEEEIGERSASDMVGHMLSLLGEKPDPGTTSKERPVEDEGKRWWRCNGCSEQVPKPLPRCPACDALTPEGRAKANQAEAEKWWGHAVDLEAQIRDFRSRVLRFLDLFDKASSVDSVGGHLVAAYQEEQKLRLWIDALPDCSRQPSGAIGVSEAARILDTPEPVGQPSGTEGEEVASYFDSLAASSENIAAEHNEAGEPSGYYRGQADAYRGAADKIRTEGSLVADGFEKGLRELGWAVSADRVARGDVWPAMVKDLLRRSIHKKRAFLAKHTYEPGTAGEEIHERVSSWCDRAEELLAQDSGTGHDKGGS